MHFEFLIEDQSGKRMLEHLLPKLITGSHTYKIHSYKGIGRIPKGMNSPRDASNRILLDALPKLLQGYGNTFAGYGEGYSAAVILICDLDDKCPVEFAAQLNGILMRCSPQPSTCFCFAIEEGEAWFLGDSDAVRSAYPRANVAVLNKYIPDSICGTWETLADAVHTGGSVILAAKGWQEVGRMKSVWADAITPFMDVSRNRSPSFKRFREQLCAMLSAEGNA